MNLYKNILVVFCSLFLLLVQGLDLSAQNTNKKTKTIKVSLESKIVDEAGNPVQGARVYSSKSRMYANATADGSFEFKTSTDDMLVIKADGYESKTITSTDESLKDGKIVLVQEKALNGENNQIMLPFGTTSERRSVGAYSVVKGEQLENTPALSIQSTLGGRLNGLFQLQNTQVPGWTNHTMFVRGGWGDYITIVDGVERTLEYIEPEVIESVELLKDATMKSLYGGLQANGILLITTKRGKAYENSVRVNVEHGVQTPTRLPKFLDSYNYATYYNQALANDGYAPLYDQTALDAYKNHTDPILYPDVDYYKEFLNETYNMTRINTQLQGGNEKSRYFAHIGYQGNGGLEKHTDYPNADDIFTVRTSIDMDVMDFIRVSAGFNGASQVKEWPNISTQNFFAPLAAHRPNEYPILIPGEMVGLPDQEYVIGGTAEKQNNPYGLLTGQGYAERRYTYIQSDLGLTFDFNKWVKGLKVKPFVSFDVYNVETATKGATFSVYEPVYNTATGEVTFNQWGTTTEATSQSRSNAEVRRNYALNVTSTYDRTFGSHDIKGILNFYQSRNEIRNVHEDPRRQNLGLHVSDMIADKYILEANINRVGVTSFSKDNRYGYFPAFGAGWILSEESFLSGAKSIDMLKLRVSYGILGSTTYTAEGGFSTHLFQDVWRQNGTINLDGENYLVSLDKTGNPNIGFQKSYEFNAGIDAVLFNRSTRISLGYFDNINDGFIGDGGNITPGVIGKNEALAFRNFKKFGLKGFEGELWYNRYFGDLELNLGANMTYGISNRIADGEPDYPADAFGGLITQGRPVDAIMGLETIGVFNDQADIDQSPLQMFGPVRPGDIKYADNNGDGYVDERDRVEIGNSSPRLQFGINLDLKFKGFNLSVLAMGYGKYNRLLNTQYYQVYGNRKYSNVVVNGLPNGNAHPKLSALATENNFVSSTYWIVNSAFLKLRNVELGYTLPHTLTQRFSVNDIKVFARGYNLLTLSKIKDLDPENLDAGIGNFPLCTTLSAGISVSF
ncbi:SusC/RagA family TonB-linked outer membrane protein [Gaoshiqia sediminis]|uniref:SusC/RagA family TonB-linked outer membrane protein n=1 Tax=Gaoshiqia sediminis TaxID=2986998 RepID=A0AA41Y8Y3_9BACT|nr:SusC/RagA family TonB-linked outer membrane protein [Gaoshiqia sediminis]MCW0484254.1 SusC/RagA family TonB-linked outer membrane protein [Gaoshiqia sediminis]